MQWVKASAPVGGGQVPGQVECQRGIQNRDARHHANVQDGAFDLRLLIGNHRRTPDFRAGPGRRRPRHL
ncbi:hypothetical protein PSYJA_33110, partial [Pseudomonas syringae pv. japonica str. M301072]